VRRGRPRAPAGAEAVAGAATAVLLVALAAADGGYFPVSWGWTALALLWTSLIAIVLGRARRPTGLDRVLIAAFGVLAAWAALSTVWSESVPRSLTEVQRDLVYLAGALAVMLVARRRWAPSLLTGVWAATAAVATYALSTRLSGGPRPGEDTFAQNRLYEPLGYWNALGILAAMGAVLAVGLAARAERLVVRALAGASLAALLPALYLTFSRGAMLALALALVVMVALDPRRLQALAALALAGWPAGVAVWLVARSDAVTDPTVTVREGSWLPPAIVLLAGLGAAGTVALARLEQRVAVSARVRRTVAAGLAAACLGALVAGVAYAGGPGAIVDRTQRSVTGPVAQVPGSPEARLGSLSSNGRIELSRIALGQWRAHPLLGSGAGTFEPWFLEHRSSDQKVRDAHNLYLETLAELGPVGLIALLVALGVPLAAARGSRHRPLAATAVAAYVAFLAHAAVDWDWEMTVVTLAAVVIGGSIVADARTIRHPAGRWLSGPPSLAAAAIVATLSVAAIVGLLGSAAAGGASRAVEAGDWSHAVAEARTATRWAPWSSDAWRLLGEARRAQGDLPGARASLRRALRRDPGDWRAWHELARTTGGSEQRYALLRARALNPRSPELAAMRSSGLRDA